MRHPFRRVEMLPDLVRDRVPRHDLEDGPTVMVVVVLEPQQRQQGGTEVRMVGEDVSSLMVWPHTWPHHRGPIVCDLLLEVAVVPGKAVVLFETHEAPVRLVARRGVPERLEEIVVIAEV